MAPRAQRGACVLCAARQGRQQHSVYAIAKVRCPVEQCAQCGVPNGIGAFRYSVEGAVRGQAVILTTNVRRHGTWCGGQQAQRAGGGKGRVVVTRRRGNQTARTRCQ